MAWRTLLSEISKPMGNPKALRMGLYGAIGGVIGSQIGEIVYLIGFGTSLLGSIIRVGLHFGLTGACIAPAILLAQASYFKQKNQLAPSIRKGASFGFLAGALAGGLAQFLYHAIGPTEFLRVICWGIAGGLLGCVLSFRIPNLGRKNGLLGGVTGGVSGGILFVILVYLFGNVAGRLFGNAAIGFFLGLMLIVAETLSRRLWLEVSYGPMEVISVNLGNESVRMGSDSSACTIYVRDVPPVALEFWVEQDRVMCKYVTTREVSHLQPGVRQKLGSVEFRVCAAEGPGSQPANPAPSDWWKEAR